MAIAAPYPALLNTIGTDADITNFRDENETHIALLQTFTYREHTVFQVVANSSRVVSSVCIKFVVNEMNVFRGIVS